MRSKASDTPGQTNRARNDSASRIRIAQDAHHLSDMIQSRPSTLPYEEWDILQEQVGA